MSILRVLLPLAIVAGLGIFVISNGGLVVPLVLLGTPTSPLPLGAWVLGAIAAGAGTTFAITALARVPAGASRTSRRRGYRDTDYAQANQSPPYRPANARPLDNDDDWQIEELGDDSSPRDADPGMRTSSFEESRGFEPTYSRGQSGQNLYENDYADQGSEQERYDDAPYAKDQVEGDRPPVKGARFGIPFGGRKEKVRSEETRRQPTRRSPLDDWDTFGTPRQSWDDWQPGWRTSETEGNRRERDQEQELEEPPDLSSNRRVKTSDLNEGGDRGDETVLQDWGRGIPSDWQDYDRPPAYDPDEDRDRDIYADRDEAEARYESGDRYHDVEYNDGGAYDRYASPYADDGANDYDRGDASSHSSEFYVDVDYPPEDNLRGDYPPDGYVREDVSNPEYAPEYDPVYDEAYAARDYPSRDYAARNDETTGYDSYEPPNVDASEDAPYEPLYDEYDETGDRSEPDMESDDSGSYVDYVRYNEDDDFYDDFEEYTSPDPNISEQRSPSSAQSTDAEFSEDSSAAPEDVSSEESVLDLDELENWDDFEEQSSTTEPSLDSEPLGSETSDSHNPDSPRRIVEVPQKPQAVTRQGTIYSYSYRNPEGSGVGQSESVFQSNTANDASGEASSERETSERETSETNP